MTEETHHPPPTRKLAAIMFTDIVGYTALMGEDEDLAFQLLKKNRQLQKPIIEKHGGTWLKEIGDAILASFPTDSDTVYCAKEIQETCRQEPDLQLRIGIHEGEVVFEEGDVFGDGVNIASRLQSIAPAEGIYISETVNRNIENKTGIDTRFVKQETLKNVKRPVRIYQVDTGLMAIPDTGKGKNRMLYYLLAGLLIITISVIIWKFLPKQSIVEMDKSIAVLPLKYLSEDQNKQYLADGVMDAITGHLSKIEGLRVIPRTSVEQYRRTTKTASVIGEELDVSYLIEGSFLMLDDQVRLTVQLVTAKDQDHVWFEEYDRDWADIFSVQSEVAEAIAKEVEVAITSEVKEIIETIPTTNLTAYDFFLRARDIHINYLMGIIDNTGLEKAISLYRRALENDSTYAQAYTGLALAYENKHYWETFLEEDFLDSILILVNKALSFDDNLDEAYWVRGIYYREAKSDYSNALKDYDKALQINPNYSWAYYSKGLVYSYDLNNYVEGIKNYHKAASLDHGPLLLRIIGNLSSAYSQIGFYDKSIHYQKEALKLNNDSSAYFSIMSLKETNEGNFDAGLKFNKKGYTYDSTHYQTIVNLIYHNTKLENFEDAYTYSLKLIELVGTEKIRNYNNTNRIAHAFWLVGKHEEAKYYFDEQIRYCLESIKLNRGYATGYYAHYDLAGVYAFLGEKEKAYQYLDVFDKRDFYPAWWVSFVKYDPLFNSIREEERFRQILQNVEAKYQKEHERVRVWLEEEGML